MDFSAILSSLGSAMQQGSGGGGGGGSGMGSFGLQQPQRQSQQMGMEQQQPGLSIFDLLRHYDQNLRERIPPQQGQNFLTGGY